MPMAQSRSRARARKQSPDAQDLMLEEAREIYSAETQLMRALPRLAKAVESQKLRQMIDERQSQGERIIHELDQAFDQMDTSPGRKRNVAAEGLINDAREHVQEIERGPALDAVLIAALQKTEHYCIAAWGTARSMGQAVGGNEIPRIMDRALKEGGQLDEELTRLAESEITPALLRGSEADEDEEEEGEGRSGSRGRQRSRSQRQTSHADDEDESEEAEEDDGSRGRRRSRSEAPT
jgi:ferritin-like metal-binding protein YciE